MQEMVSHIRLAMVIRRQPAIFPYDLRLLFGSRSEYSI